MVRRAGAKPPQPGQDRSTRLLPMQGPLAATAAVAVLVLSSGAAWAQNCSSFQTCAQAVASMKAGNTKLDRDTASRNLG